MNQFYNDKLIANIKQSILESKNAKKVNHRFLQGRIREILVDLLLRPILPFQFSIGTGKITDVNGKQSGETDLIIYSKSLISPILYDERFGIFPIDSVLATIEVKSSLNATTLKQAIESSSSSRSENFEHLSGFFDIDTSIPKPQNYTGNFRCLFSYSSKLKVKSEMDRYKEYDPDWETNPVIQAICVIGKGFWIFQNFTERPGWRYVVSDKKHTEVLGFLRVLVDSVQQSVIRRGNPMIGHYLLENPEFHIL